MKIPKLDGFQYFCLRASGLVIGGATVIYVVCANVEQVMGGMEIDRPLEGAIKWKRKYWTHNSKQSMLAKHFFIPFFSLIFKFTVICLMVYTSWIYGIVMEQTRYLKYVLVLWIASIIYTLAHIFILLGFVVRDSRENIHDKAISSLCSILLKAGDYILLIFISRIMVFRIFIPQSEILVSL